MSPFEREEPRMVADGGGVAEEYKRRLATEPWLPHQYKWAGVTTIGLIGGIRGGYIYITTASSFLGYAISAMSLFF